MKEFTLLFRATRALDPEALQRRNAAAREWALALQRQGALRSASPLEADGALVRQSGVAPVAGIGAIASVLVVGANDLDAAVALATGHPGLAFGTEIEVRPVKAVGAPAASSGTSTRS